MDLTSAGTTQNAVKLVNRRLRLRKVSEIAGFS